MRSALIWLTLCLTLPALAGPLQVRGRQFVGAAGRPLILRGLNVAQASKQPPYLPWQTAADFARIRDWGGNCVRLLIIWAAVEPAPGQYDDGYLAAVRERLDWAHEAGLYVILDMHQDLYGEKYGGDGAPPWACLDGGAAYEVRPGQHWAAAYFQPAVMAAFDSFWNNAPGPEGVGLQDRFVAAWRHVAETLGDHPAVIGYDLLNEPFYGNALAYPETIAALLKLQAMFPAGANALDLFTRAPTGPLRDLLRDPDWLFPALDMGAAIYARFERERLTPLYQRLIPALQQVTPGAIFFLEPHILAAGGAPSILTRPAAAAGVQLAYAPHFYDPGCSPDVPYDEKPERARRAFARIAEVAARLEAPVFLGEWGAAESPSATADQYVRDQTALLREFGFSHCYWQYGPELAQKPEFAALQAALSAGQ